MRRTLRLLLAAAAADAAAKFALEKKGHNSMPAGSSARPAGRTEASGAGGARGADAAAETVVDVERAARMASRCWSYHARS